MILRSDQVITVIEARKLLGREAESLTDQEILKLIEDLDIIAQYTIKLVQKFKKNKNETDE